MSTIYYILAILIYAAIILGIGFYIAYIIYRHNDDVDRIIRACKSIIEDFTKIAECVEQNNRLFANVMEKRDKVIKIIR